MALTGDDNAGEQQSMLGKRGGHQVRCSAVSGIENRCEKYRVFTVLTAGGDVQSIRTQAETWDGHALERRFRVGTGVRLFGRLQRCDNAATLTVCVFDRWRSGRRI